MTKKHFRIHDDFIQLDEQVNKDRIIRNIYTPKEIVGIIHWHFIQEVEDCSNLSKGEELVLWNSFNRLIERFKDD